MIRHPLDSTRPGVLTARRVTLLASAAALGATMLLTGPGGYRPAGPWSSPAIAAETTAQHPAGFADIVAKVKPAVISVRVKIDAAAAAEPMQQDSAEDAVPFDPTSPMYKFFKQFGWRHFPQGLPRHETITGEGSGFFITADGYAVTNNHVVDHAKSVQVTTDDGAN